jgi:DNA-binding response OmpR family regulator
MGILIVEDDGPSSMRIEDILKRNNYKIADILYKAKGVLERAIQSDISLILLDINLSNNTNDLAGISIAKEIRKIVNTPIIFFTGYSSVKIFNKTKDIENSFYIIKPIREVELLSGLNNYLGIYDKIIKLDNEFSFNMKTLELKQNNVTVNLYNQEAKLLQFFIANNNKELTYSNIEQKIWNEPVNESTRNALVSRLRKKLNNKFITTVIKTGYKFCVNQ